MDNNIYIYHYNYLSNWLLLFFILYYIRISPYNPIFLIIGGLIVMAILTIQVYRNNNNINDVIVFGQSTIFNKIIPAILLIGSPIYYKDLIFNIVILFVYITYMNYYNKIGIVQFYKNLPKNYNLYSKNND